jgi:hypothetical protein
LEVRQVLVRQVLAQAQVSKTQRWRSSVKAGSLLQRKVDLLMHLVLPLEQLLWKEQQPLEGQALPGSP